MDNAINEKCLSKIRGLLSLKCDVYLVEDLKDLKDPKLPGCTSIRKSLVNV